MRWKYNWFYKEEHEISCTFLIGEWVGILRPIRDGNSGEWIRPFNETYNIMINYPNYSWRFKPVKTFTFLLNFTIRNDNFKTW